MTQALSATRTNTPGPDGLPLRLFRTLSKTNLNLLLNTFNNAWENARPPEDWSDSILVPILKPNSSAKLPSSYRPISLTSVSSKIFERMLLRRLTEYSIQNNLFHPNHHGFLPFRDCSVTLTRIHHDILIARQKREFVTLISLDIKSAYDTVWVDGLIFKMLKLGFTGKAAHWIHNILSLRTYTVRWRKHFSTKTKVSNGIQQGSVLSPFLFMIFIHDIFEIIPLGVQCYIYADDIFLVCSGITWEKIKSLLQRTLDNLSLWFKYWKLQFSTQKSKIINLSRRHTPPSFYLSLNSTRIEWTPSLKILGLIFSKNLTWRAHFLELRSKVSKRLSALKAVAASKWGARTFHLLQLVQSTIRSVIDYGCQIYSSASFSERYNLESLYHTALRFATGLPRSTPIPLLLLEAGSSSLYTRHTLLTSQFYLRHLSLGTHTPLHPCFRFFQRPRGLTWNPERGPLTYRYRNLFSDLNFHPNQLIHWTPPFQWKYYPNIYIKTIEFDFQTKNLPPAIICDLFKEHMTSNWSSSIIIASDASKSSDNTAYAALNWNAGSSISHSIPHLNSIFTAEALAMWSAITNFITEYQDYVILSDSLSVLQSLLNISLHSPFVILHITKALQTAINLARSINIIWVPAHVGIPPNEAADHLAKLALTSSTGIITYSPDDLRRVLQSEHRQNCLSRWRLSRYYEDFPYMENCSSIHRIAASNRRGDVLLSKLRTKTLPTQAWLYKIRAVDTPLCSACHVPDTTEHFIITCCRYDSLRQSLFQAIQWPPGVPWTFQDLMAFLNKSPSYFQTIEKFLTRSQRFHY